MMERERDSQIGKITLATFFIGAAFALFGVVFDIFHINQIEEAWADLATTSVTVLNTAPSWTVDAQESPESSTTTPTNSGSNVTWTGTATDSSLDDYYLIICTNNATPTANASAPPTCSGGIGNQWGVSAATASGAQATAATTTTEAMVESNVWYGWICDGSPSLPKCNDDFRQGSGSTASPFLVNHRPTFTVFFDDSPVVPGATATWYSTSSDADVVDVGDQVRLFVCQANDFTGGSCGAGGTYCSSATTTSDPSCNYVVPNPTQDANYSAFGFIIDNHSHAATGGQQGANSVLTVSNVAPTISSSSVSLLDTDGVGALTLTVEQNETTGFQVKFTVTDNNSCVANSSTTNEISTLLANVYRSGITQTGCDASGEYNTNNCYPQNIGSAVWNISCIQDAGSCLGPTDASAAFTCTFPLWYLADPTDAGTQFPSEDWLASVQASDDNFATSTLIEAETGNDLQSFLAYNLATATIPYGGLEPGQSYASTTILTNIEATGNTGIDETLYGEDMCTTYTVPGSCPVSATSTIPVGEQRYATSTADYATSPSLLVNPGVEFEINVPKTTATDTPEVRGTYWGIAVPGTITLSGDYIGENTFIGVVGESSDW